MNEKSLEYLGKFTIRVFRKVMHVLFVTREYCFAMKKKKAEMLEFEFWNTLTKFHGERVRKARVRYSGAMELPVIVYTPLEVCSIIQFFIVRGEKMKLNVWNNILKVPAPHQLCKIFVPYFSP